MIFHGNPSAIAAKFSRIWQSFDVMLYRICTSSAACCFRTPSVAILTSVRARGERRRAVDQSRERSRPRSPLPEPQLIHIPMSDGDDDQPPQTGRQRQRSRSRERSYPHAQVPQGPQVQPMIIHEPVTDPDEDPTVVNPS